MQKTPEKPSPGGASTPKSGQPDQQLPTSAAHVADGATDAGTAEDMGPRSAAAQARRPGPLAVMQSVVAAFFGVQSERNRARDFANGRASTYIIAGLVATMTFISVVWTVVSLVLHNVAG